MAPLTTTTTNNLFLLLSLSLLVSLHVDAGNRTRVEPTPLVNQTCQGTPFPDVCLFALTSSSQSTSSDLHGLARISIDSAIKKAQAFDVFVGGLLKVNHTTAVQQVLAECRSNHAHATTMLRSGNKELASGPMGRLNACNFLDAAIWEVQRCEAKMQKQATEQNLLTTRNEDFVKFCVNSKAILNMPGV